LKILLAVDGSHYGDVAVKEVIQRTWPASTEVRVLSVAHPTPYFHDPLLVGAGTHFDSLRDEQKRASHDVAKVEDELRQQAPHLQISTKVLEGSPKEKIIEEARQWNSDLIILGSHGHGPVGPFLLGSVALEVALHAPCSVEIVRPRDTNSN
jgi:nucleotide-binding universal stress UspA family protein